MVFSQMRKLWGLTSSIGARFGKMVQTGDQGNRRLKTRHLSMDMLEERALLSLSVATVGDIIVNDQWQDIRGDISVASNEAGDAVVTWTAADTLYDPSTTGTNDPQLLTDPLTGQTVEDLNIYARYLTNEVQRITLDSSLAPTPGASAGGTFELTYDKNEVQVLKFTTASDPNYNGYYDELMYGTINIGLWVDNQLIWGYDANDPYDKGKLYTFDESLSPSENAANLQEYIRTNTRFLGRYTEVEVVAVDQRELQITYYGKEYEGKQMPEMRVIDCDFTSGFMGGAIVTSSSTPTLATSYNKGTGAAVGITVSSDPWVTAARIQNAFNSNKSFEIFSPTSRGWFYDETTHTYSYSYSGGFTYYAGSSYEGGSDYFSTVEVEVTPVTLFNETTGKYEVSTTVFDVTFVGNSGLQDVQEIQISSMKQRGTTTNLAENSTETTLFGVETIKQSSPVFRVNSVEPVEYLTSTDADGNTIIETDEDGNPILEGTGKQNQSKPVVTMDNDGEFTIVWQTDVEDISDPYNHTDIYARRFTVQGIVDAATYDDKVGFYVDGGTLDTDVSRTYVPQANQDPYLLDVTSVAQAQGVRPLADQFRVNVSTNGSQVDPQISSDLDGNFVITWTSEAQWNSYFSGIAARWYDKNGLAVTGEVAVTSQTVSYGTPTFGPSYVDMSREGYTVILYNQGQNALYKSVFGKVNTTEDAVAFVANSLVASGAYGASVDFDSNGRYVIGYTKTEATAIVPYTDVYATGYQITLSATESYSESVYINTFQVNQTTSDPLYSSGSKIIDQGNVSVGVDADGDMFISYQGYGSDIQYIDTLSGGIRTGFVSLYSTGTTNAMSLLFSQDLVYFHRKVTYETSGKYAYEGKNDDLLGTDEELAALLELDLPNYDIPSLYSNGILYKALAYANSSEANAVDKDTYIRACLVGASIAGANTDQLGRLNAMLDGICGQLDGAANDILYTKVNNTGILNGGDPSGTVNDYRDGSNARMIIAVPATGLAEGSITFVVERDMRNFQGIVTDTATGAANSFTITVDFPVDDNGRFSAKAMQDALTAAFNAVEGYRADSFLVSNVTSQVAGWVGTDYEIPSYYTMTQEGWYVFEVTFQIDAHDCPYFIRYNGSSLTYTGSAEGATAITHNSNNGRISNYLFMSNYGSMGTAQINSHVAMTNSGDVTVVWAQQADNYTYGQNSQTGGSVNYVDDTYVAIGNSVKTKSEQIYLRLFSESTDTAGPTVTQVALPDGSRVEEGNTVTSTVKDIVVSFDERLLTKAQYTDEYSQLHAVDNLDNWELLCDGIIVQDAIESIVFGMSASKILAENSTSTVVNNGLLALGSNKWEAVITFKDGKELTTGNYTLVAKNSIQDISHNALYAQGLNYDGKKYEINFSVISLNTPLAFDTAADPFVASYVPETVVSDMDIDKTILDSAVIDNTTRTSILDDDASTFDQPNTPTSVASDSNGNFVAVWTVTVDEDNPNPDYSQTGVWVKIYRQAYVADQNDKRTVTTEVIAEYRISGTEALVDSDGDVYFAKQASVAMNDLGDFVVTWDQYNGETESREVYARRYDITGRDIGINGLTGTNFRVNVEMEYDQQNAAVAMDADGDFAIVWESYAQDYAKQKTWGIYGRRFTNDGYSFGITDTQQTITIGGAIVTDKYVMRLTYTDENGNEYTTSDIAIQVETAKNTENIYAALLALTDSTGKAIFTTDDLAVTMSGTNQILVSFKGKFANTNVDLLTSQVFEISSTGAYLNTTKVSVNISETSTGTSGSEFLVNDTLENHQRFPSISMDGDGNFVVSWTSWGQGADSSTETNIYAKRYVSNTYLQSKASTSKTATITNLDTSIDYVIGSNAETLNTNSGDSQFTGVCYITVGTGDAAWSGTGSLLTTGSHILTAAHVVTDEAGVTVAPTSITVMFEVSGKMYTYDVQEVYVNPDYTGDTATSPDIAILQLSEQADGSIATYDINRDTNELGQVFTTVGYGFYGLATDDDETTEARAEQDVVKHWGQNKYELTGNELNATYIAGQLVFDFDDGTVTNDYIGNNYGIRDIGLGVQESSSAPGDSGGPSFINGKIVAVTSWGISGEYGPTYGSYGADVRVSSYADWIDSILVGGLGGEFLVNEGMEAGNQIWSSVALDDSNNFVITWTGYNQDNHGDSLTGSTRNGLGGIFARRYYVNSNTANYVANPCFLVNDFTENDQIHSQVSTAYNGDFVIVWESYKDREDQSSDVPSSFGVYAKRYVNTTDYFNALSKLVVSTPTDDDNESETGTGTGTGTGDDTDDGTDDGTGTGTDDGTDDGTGTGTDDDTNNNIFGSRNGNKAAIVTSFPSIPAGLSRLDIPTIGYVGVYGEYGTEFCVENIYPEDTTQKTNQVNTSVAGDQVGISVALNANGDMIFVWTNMGVRSENPDGSTKQGSEVVYRTVTLADDNDPPTVTSVWANHTDSSKDEETVNIINGYNFAVDQGPYELTFTFSELMFSDDMVKAIDGVNDTVLRENFDTEREFQEAYSAAIMNVLNAEYDRETKATKSILNPSNWSLLKDGVEVFTAMYAGKYGLSYQFDAEGRGTYVLTIGFYETDAAGNPVKDADGNIVSTLTGGSYVLTLRDNVTDLFNNKLDGDYDGEAGGSFSVRFSVAGAPDSDTPTDDDTGDNTGDAVMGSDATVGHNCQDVASYIDSNGLEHFIIVAQTERIVANDDDVYDALTNPKLVDGQDEDGNATQYILITDIVMREYVQDSSGKIVSSGSEVYVTNAAGNQYNPSIAMTSAGSYVIAWSGAGTAAANGVYANFYVNNSVITKFVSNSSAICKDVKVAISGETVLITWIQGSTDGSAGGDKVMGRIYQINGEQPSEVFVLIDGGTYSVQYYDTTADQNGTVGAFGVTYNLLQRSNTKNIADIITRTYTVEALKSGTGVRKGMYYSKNDLYTFSKVTNDTILGQQDDPQIAMDNSGNVFVTWASSVDGLFDVYAKSYTVSGSARSLGGTTSEYLVNTITKEKQYQPDISVSADGSTLLITWISFKCETSNYDVENFTELYDFGIAARLFDGQTGAAIINPINNNTNEWNVNTIHNGEQLIPSCTVINTPGTELHYVITWTGPYKFNTSLVETGGILLINGEEYDTTPGYRQVFFKYYPTADFGMSTYNDTSIMDATVKNMSTAYSVGKPETLSTNNAYNYSPAAKIGDKEVETTVSTVLTIDGTDGNDKLVFQAATSISKMSITLNGKKVTIPTGTQSIVFNGGNGSDTVIINGSSASETANIDAAKGTVLFAGFGFTFSGYGLETVNLTGNSGTDTVNVSTSKGTNTLSIAPGTLQLECSGGFQLNADGFEKVYANSTTGSDVAILKDSEEDDQLTLSNNYAQMAGADFTHEVTGFSSVRAFASEGFDSVVASDINWVNATSTIVCYGTASSSILTMNFDNTTVSALGGSSATVTGSRGDDRLDATQTEIWYTWSNGTRLNMNNVYTLNVTANGGNDIANLQTASTKSASFVGHQNESVLINGGYSKTLKGFSKVSVQGSGSAFDSAILYDTSNNDLLTLEGDRAILNSAGSDMYELLAFDQVSAKKEKFSGTANVVQNSIDFAFETESWTTL